MAKVTPAMITYTVTKGQPKSVIQFHAVIAEAHIASSQITKFPVQEGFEVSNNKIRKNRVITIEGVITNHILEGSEMVQYHEEGNNARVIFDALQALVNTGTPCEVITNLGLYNPVVFNKFNTKQMKGRVDSMHFSISGEELQVKEAVRGAGPKVLSFNSLNEASSIVRAGELAASGIDVCECNTITEAKFKVGEDFIVEGEDNLGLPVKTTYIARSIDPTTMRVSYNVSTSATDMYIAEADKVLPTGGLLEDVDRAGGFSQISDCLTESGGSIVEEATEEFISTAMGDLKKDAYGVLYDTMQMTGNDYGQSLIHSGVGCFVRGLTKEVSDFPYQPGEALPSTEEIMSGARRVGEAVFGSSEDVRDGNTLTSLPALSALSSLPIFGGSDTEVQRVVPDLDIPVAPELSSLDGLSVDSTITQVRCCN